MTTHDLQPIIRGCFEAVEAVCKDRVELSEKLARVEGIANHLREIIARRDKENADLRLIIEALNVKSGGVS